MASTRSFPSRDVLRRPRFSPVDVVVFVAIALLLFGILRLAHSLNSSSASAHVAVISTDPANLPYYAARSLLRIFNAFFLSVVFTFIYATAAARSRRARIVLIPILDILQSVPVLGFLAITVTFFIALFPGSELGLEHDVQHVPLAYFSAGGAGRGGPHVPPDQVGAFLAPGRAQLDDRAGLERDVELRGWLVLPGGFGGDQRRQQDLHAARDRLLRGGGRGQGRHRRGGHRHRGDGDPGGGRELRVLAAAGGLRREVPGGDVGVGRTAQELRAEPAARVEHP